MCLTKTHHVSSIDVDLPSYCSPSTKQLMPSVKQAEIIISSSLVLISPKIMEVNTHIQVVSPAVVALEIATGGIDGQPPALNRTTEREIYLLGHT